MPTYKYRCDSCEIYFEDFKTKVSERNNQLCIECDGEVTLCLQPVHFDYRMGTDPDGFPTMGDKWAKIQREKNTGKKWDSNNDRYGGDYKHSE